MVDVTVRKSLMRRTPEDAYGILDDMALNAFSWNSDRSSKRPSGIHIISTQAALVAQVKALQRQLNKMNAPQHQMFNYEFCGGNHNSMDCQVSASSEQVTFLGNFQGDKQLSKANLELIFKPR